MNTSHIHTGKTARGCLLQSYLLTNVFTPFLKAPVLLAPFPFSETWLRNTLEWTVASDLRLFLVASSRARISLRTLSSSAGFGFRSHWHQRLCHSSQEVPLPLDRIQDALVALLVWSRSKQVPQSTELLFLHSHFEPPTCRPAGWTWCFLRDFWPSCQP